MNPEGRQRGAPDRHCRDPGSGSCSIKSSQSGRSGSRAVQQIRHVVSERAADREFHRQIVNEPGILPFVGLRGADPTLRQCIPDRTRQDSSWSRAVATRGSITLSYGFQSASVGPTIDVRLMRGFSVVNLEFSTVLCLEMQNLPGAAGHPEQ